MKTAAPLLSRKNPDYLQRASWHDYRSRCIYMLTMTKSACTPELSRITAMTANGKAVPRVELLPPGIVVVEALGRWVRRYPCLTLMHSVIMPDHIHLLVFVKEKSELTLGEMAGKFKGECSRLWWSHDATCLNKPFFAKGFNDKIVYRKGQKDNFYNYSPIIRVVILQEKHILSFSVNRSD